MKVSPNFYKVLPNTPEVMEFVKKARKFLRGSGFYLKVHGRNPDRKQFYKNDRYYFKGGGVAKHAYQQDLPLQHATKLALYLRGSSGSSKNPRELNLVKKAISTLDFL